VKTGAPCGPAAQLGRLCSRYRLAPRQREQFEEVLRRLAADERAPTTVREPARAVDVHLADSLVALEVDALRTAGRIADLGSGAGFPGLALAVALPGSEVALVESQARKCAFLADVCRAVGATNAQVVCARAEGWAEGRGANDAVLARALAPQAVVVEYAAPLLRVGGTLVEWRGRRDAPDERSGRRAAERLGMELLEVRRVEPHPAARDHHLHLYLKTRPTPAGFPRRAGMARKRPLGG
jgi:16S rRNA (guanine527-N7)-methyltransferase